MKELAVSIQNLEFHYRNQTKNCLNNISLSVTAGDRFGLFGPNGAGKTTLMHCMTGLLLYHQGSIRLFDIEVKNNRKKVNRLFGFVPQEFSFYQELSPLQNLSFFGALCGLDKIAIKKKSTELLEVLGLSTVAHQPVHQFSGGMKRRVNLAIGVLHAPRILFLDEPTVGVDVQTRHAIIEYLKNLNSTGTTLIYTSHQLNEAAELCNKIALIDEGKIIAHHTLQQLLTDNNCTDLERLFIQLTGKIIRDIDV